MLRRGELLAAPSPGRRSWQYLLGLWSMLVIAVLGMSYWKVVQLRREAALSFVQATIPPPNPGPPGIRPSWDPDARHMLRDRGTAWPEALRSLEHIDRAELTLAQVSIHVPDGVLRIELGAAQPGRILSVLEDLGRGTEGAALGGAWELVSLRDGGARGYEAVIQRRIGGR